MLGRLAFGTPNLLTCNHSFRIGIIVGRSLKIPMQNLCDIVPTTSISIFAKIRRPLYVSACSFSSKGKSLKDKIREQLEIQKEGLREKVHMQFKIQKEHLKGKIHEQLEVRKKHLRENVMTIPNCLCFLRIGLTPAIGYFVISEYFFIAFSLFIAAGATDLLDGYIARNMRGQSSLVGSVLDPIADKFLISTLFITLTYVHLVPLQLTSIVILRDIALIIGGFILRYKTLEPPFTIKRFFNPSVSPVEVAPTLVSKQWQRTVVNTFTCLRQIGIFVNPSSKINCQTASTSSSRGEEIR